MTHATDVSGAGTAPATAAALAAVGPRLREARSRRGLTLATVARATGLTVSTLSRLETGRRRPVLDQLLPLAALYGTSLHDLTAPRHPPPPRTRDGMLLIPLSRAPGTRAYRRILPAGLTTGHDPRPRSHPGHHWLYVLTGRLRLVLGDRDLDLTAGEAAAFDTRLPHWFGNGDRGPVELLSIHGPQGEPVRLRATGAPPPGPDTP
ncbi:helix-turn-helix domain-containing protein [Streptomyces carpaticus]|uniref:Helix-turn-helix domain-containing protein n=1 Tax=Streptomyces carpaticus TaxID=285558 RepID=A0ABV4ZRF3_9ACTN